MKIILSPAKTMQEADDDFTPEGMPRFPEKTEALLAKMRAMDSASLKKLWNCSSRLAEENEERLRRMDLYGRLTPAVCAYTGLAYRHLAVSAMTEKQLAYIKDHLYILSGFYGLLGAFDGITPYRLEMQAVFPDGMTLYDYWGSLLHDALMENDGLIINLASREYAKCITPYLRENERMITCVFGEEKNGKILQKGTAAKMARGEAVFWMSENSIENPEDLKRFGPGYTFREEFSSADEYVFTANAEETL